MQVSAAPFDGMVGGIATAQAADVVRVDFAGARCSFLCTFTVSSTTDNGILMESGGNSTGVILYYYNGYLYLNCGEFTEISYALGTGTYSVGCSIDGLTDGDAYMYVDNEIVASQTFTPAEVYGSDLAGVGWANSKCMSNSGGWSSDQTGTFSTNTISDAYYYNYDVTSDFSTVGPYRTLWSYAGLYGEKVLYDGDLLGGTTETQATFAARITVADTDDDGIVIEIGGTGQGAIIYVYGGVLYAQCGDGNAYGSDSDTAEISYTLPGTGTYDIMFSADNTNAVLKVDGATIGSDAYSESYVHGGNSGAVGSVGSTLSPVNRGGWTSSGQGAFSTNTIDMALYWPGQVTADV